MVGGVGSFSFKGAAVGNMVGAPVNGALVLGADVGNVVGSIVGEEVGVVVGAADGSLDSRLAGLSFKNFS